jgi:hypothetical protein
MGIDVQLRRESTDILAEVNDARTVLARARHRAFSSTRLLKYLVPWGDAVPNQAQADGLESNIAYVRRARSEPDFLAMLDAIEPLVAHLARETHVYFWYGGGLTGCPIDV